MADRVADLTSLLCIHFMNLVQKALQYIACRSDTVYRIHISVYRRVPRFHLVIINYTIDHSSPLTHRMKLALKVQQEIAILRSCYIDL
jgi:hypothetical protein